MKIKLIAPARKPEWGESFWDLKTLCKLLGSRANCSPLGLPILAALTPRDVEVVISDEAIEPLDFEERVDLVGITGITCFIDRSYEIADEFRRRGVPVVMGGIHVSMLPDEALLHCDSVVAGEAEELWGAVIEDAKNKRLQKIYRASRFPDLADSPIPRWDALKLHKYNIFTLQTGRGCPYDCDFCSVKLFSGREYRHKSIEQVIEEVKILQKIDPRKFLFFTDDNILAVPQYTEELMKRLMPLRVKWICQASINRLKDDQLLKLMRQAGCYIIFVGFESLSAEALQAMNKNYVNRVEDYKETIKKVHSHGIAFCGSFVMGYDNDNEAVFKDLVKFVDDTNIAFAMVNVLSPLPGTKLFERLKNENRLLNFNWWKINTDWVCYKPALISQEKLQSGHTWVLEQVYDYAKLYKRMKNMWDNGIFLRDEVYKKRLTKSRIALTLYALFSCDLRRAWFIIKSLWYPKCTSVAWILVALAYHDYAYKLRKPHKNPA